MCELQKTQREARLLTAKRLQDEPRFQFPSFDGAEMVSRWDMHRHPPDILITNVSMLSAMLAREVESPIFAKTRRWLKENDDSYFFLVLDELHLQRGSAGTEVSCLLRILFHRLGITHRDHRHKLRILASSASLPMDGDERQDSLEYLWDFFGRHGTHRASRKPGATGKEFWESCVVTGVARKEDPTGTRALTTPPFAAFLRQSKGTATEVADVSLLRDDAAIWKNMAATLLDSPPPGSLKDVIKAAVEEAGRRLAQACWSKDEKRSRATGVSDLAKRLFGSTSSEAMGALRGLLVLRGAGEVFAEWFPGSDERIEAPSFRIHTFFRSIEGLFGPADGNFGVAELFRSSERPVGLLDVERDVKLERRSDTGDRPKRHLELLYCECCGELFFGGRRPQANDDEPELLPTDPDLEGLPDSSSSKLFEDLSHKDFAVFWPAGTRQPLVPQSIWKAATLDPETGQVRKLGRASTQTNGVVRGYLYLRANTQDRHKRKTEDSGTAVPYECPACGEDYSQRDRPHRLSPIRSFRAGFAKTTQLLATEVFDLLRLGTRGSEPKLVSFSDSRQDAAHAALDIERRHHEDVRRQVLVRTAREYLDRLPSKSAAADEITRLKAESEQALNGGDFEKLTNLGARLRELQLQANAPSDPIVRLSNILECVAERAKFQGPRSGRTPLRPLLRHFVELGIHPTDPTGIEQFAVGSGRERLWLDWHLLFHLPNEAGGEIDWYDPPRPHLQSQFDDARKALVEKAQRGVIEIIFSKTYFSLEETGLGYACVPRGVLEKEAYDRTNAFLRVFGDSYRFDDSPWGGDKKPGWQTASDVRGRVAQFGHELWQDPNVFDRGIEQILKRWATPDTRRDSSQILTCVSTLLQKKMLTGVVGGATGCTFTAVPVFARDAGSRSLRTSRGSRESFAERAFSRSALNVPVPRHSGSIAKSLPAKQTIRPTGSGSSAGSSSPLRIQATTR
jgi:hypothetical protein